MKKLLIWCILFFVAFSTTACADLMNGRSDRVEQVVHVDVDVEVDVDEVKRPTVGGNGAAASATEATTVATTTEPTTEATTVANTTEATTEATTTEETTEATECSHEFNNLTYDEREDRITWWCDHCKHPKQEEPTKLSYMLETGGTTLRIYVEGGVYPAATMYAVNREDDTLVEIDLDEEYHGYRKSVLTAQVDVDNLETVIIYVYDDTHYRWILQKFDMCKIDGGWYFHENGVGLAQYLDYISK